MAEHLMEKLKHTGVRVSAEGMQQADWVLIDGGDIIVPRCGPSVRAFSKLGNRGGGRPPPVESRMDYGLSA